MKALHVIKYLILAAALLGAVFIAARYLNEPPERTARMRKATIEDVRTLARLCSMEIYEDMPMRDSIGSRHIFARVKVRGTIGFDLDSLDTDLSADTVRITLPPASVTLYEDVTEGSYEVVDTWNDRLLASSYLTPAEENIMKRRLKERVIRRLHTDGTVDRARREASANLRRLLEAAFDCPVEVK